MPSIRQVPDNKRRSRNGCLPCRKRRRKCDEHKPQCGSCISRNHSCTYPGLSFVLDSNCGRKAATGIEEASASSGLEVVARDGHSQPQAAPNDQGGRFASLVHFSSQLPYLGHQQDPSLLPFRAPSHPSLHASSESQGSPLSIESPAGRRMGHSATSVSASSTSDVEAGFLTSFVYDIVPWVVSTCPGSKFANSVIGLAERQPAVRDAMIALVRMRNVALRTSDARESVKEHEIHHLDRVERDLDNLDAGLAMHLARSLLSVARLYGSRPADWIELGPKSMPVQGSLEEPLRYLLQMQGKTQLASCILTKTPPSISLVSYFEQSASVRDSTIRTAYLACLFQLAQCLRLIYHSFAQLSTASARLSDGQSPAEADATDDVTGVWSSWHSLWTSCLHWYQARPPEMEPIFGLSSAEVTESPASFPVELYSTPIALQANMAMHLSFMVLITHKPRLLKVPRPQARLASDSWHAQKIAGIAVSNHFKEQFDPLFVAALLVAAGKMTHESQQAALLRVFHDVECKMGIMLDDEVARLEKIWQTFRYDDG